MESRRWGVWADEDPLIYPYDDPQPIRADYADRYDRNIFQLLASLACFGHRIENNASVMGAAIQPPLRIPISTLTRLCEDTTIAEDFPSLMVQMPPPHFETRHIYPSQTLNGALRDVLTTLFKNRTIDQMIFYHLSGSEISLFLVLPARRTIEGFYIGNVSLPDIEPVAKQIGRLCDGWYHDSNHYFSYRHRLKIPSTFPTNNVVMGFFLLLSLHSNSTYLDFNVQTIAYGKHCILEDFIDRHDKWLGQLLQVDQVTHPFYCPKVETETLDPTVKPPPVNHQKHLDELRDLGFAIFDVEGDGNCGYYTLLLGLENIGKLSYRPSVRHNNVHIPIHRNRPWQFSVVKLRRELQHHAEDLLANIYKRGKRK